MWIAIASSDKNRKQKFLEEMEEALPWGTLLAMCRRHYQEGEMGRPKTGLELLLKIYFLQQWYNLGDPTVEAEIHDSIAFRTFLGIDIGGEIPDESTICRFRHFLEAHKLPEKFFRKTVKILKEKGQILRRGTIVDATIIQASGSTKNKEKKRDEEMSSTKKNNTYHFGMKEHIGTDLDSGLIHSIEATTAKVHDSKKMDDCLHGEEDIVSGDRAYADKERKRKMRAAGKIYLIIEKATRSKKLSPKQQKKNRKIAAVRSKGEHPFGIIKNLWKHRSVRYKGIFKNHMQWNTLALLANFYMLRKTPLFVSP